MQNDTLSSIHDGPLTQFPWQVALVHGCDSSDVGQQWIFHPDSTVESAAFPGQCWNAIGGQTGAGTNIILYQCGDPHPHQIQDPVPAGVVPPPVKSNPALNDFFYYDLASRSIIGNESNLCFSAPQAPMPPGTCGTQFSKCLHVSPFPSIRRGLHAEWKVCDQLMRLL